MKKLFEMASGDEERKAITDAANIIVKEDDYIVDGRQHQTAIATQGA